MKNNVNRINATINHASTLAKWASFGILRKLHAASGNDTMLKFIQTLAADIDYMDHYVERNNRLAELISERDALNAILADKDIESAEIVASRNSLTAEIAAIEKSLIYAVSDAYDIYQVAYEYFYSHIANGDIIRLDCEYDDNGNEIISLAYDDETNTMISVKRKGEYINITLYQYCYKLLRKYIYSNRAIMEGSANYTYLSDIAASADDNSGLTEGDIASALYIRAGKWYDMPSIEDYETQAAIIAALNLTDIQNACIHYRLQGFSNRDIAHKLNVSDAAISKHFSAIRRKAEKNADLMGAYLIG